MGFVTRLAARPRRVAGLALVELASMAALALGAVGIQMGTRFICTVECPVHENYKDRIVRAHDRSTLVTGAAFGHPVRSLRGAFVRELEKLERDGCSMEEFMAYGAGTLRRAIVDGEVQQGTVMAGQSAGLVKDIVTVAELVDRIILEAEAVLRGSCSFVLE